MEKLSRLLPRLRVGLGCIAALVSTLGFAAERPNVLLICIDDLKPAIGCFGDAAAKTPNIDALARRGVVFQAAYCNQAVCSPSRNALLLSLRPQTIGIFDLATNFREARPRAITLGEHFKANGYHTAAIGKIFHVGQGNHEDPQSWSVPHWRPNAPQYRDPESLQNMREVNGQRKGPATEATDVPDEAYGDGQIALEAVKRLEVAAQNPDRPFLLAVGFHKPHLPFVSPQKYWDLHDPNKLPQPKTHAPPEGAPACAPTTYGELRTYSDMPQRGPIDAATTRQLIHGYYAAASFTDVQIGRVLAALGGLGLSKNTIVVLWGDHGWHLGDHGMWCKHTNYEQATRIPVIVSAPGMAAGEKTAAMIESVDIFPTLCDLAGIAPPPEKIDGRSFAAVLASPKEGFRESVIQVYPRGERLGRAIRTPRYRLVEWKVPGSSAEKAEYELYDYEDDPDETKNLAADRPEVVADLTKILAEHPEAKPQIKVAAAAGSAAGNAAKKPVTDRVALFKRKDANGDGKLTKEEFLKNQPDPDEAPERFQKFDANDDGVLSESEFFYQGQVPK